MTDDEARELLDNLDQFRAVTVETLRVLHSKQKKADARYLDDQARFRSIERRLTMTIVTLLILLGVAFVYITSRPL